MAAMSSHFSPFLPNLGMPITPFFPTRVYIRGEKWGHESWGRQTLKGSSHDLTHQND